VPRDEALESIGTESSAARTGKNRFRWSAAPFRYSTLEDRDDIWPQRSTPHLPAFPDTTDVSADSELNILATQRGEFTVPQTRLDRS